MPVMEPTRDRKINFADIATAAALCLLILPEAACEVVKKWRPTALEAPITDKVRNRFINIDEGRGGGREKIVRESSS